MKKYSLDKSHSILEWAYKWYRKQGAQLRARQDKEQIENLMERLQTSLNSKDEVAADNDAKALENFVNKHYKKSIWSYVSEIGTALLFALIVAGLIRSMWFELYEIPTGSMRPTFMEQDHLTVTKTAFGINTPMATSHLYFDPSLVQRTSIFIFSADNLPMSDSDTMYFGVIPYKKRLIKRCLGKPGDTLYFYGGKLWGIDAEDNEIAEFHNTSWMQNVESVPFMSFHGEVNNPRPNEVTFSLMNTVLGRIVFTPFAGSVGEVFNGHEWIKDSPLAQKQSHDDIQTYSDFWGIRNYAMARLLTKEQAKKAYDSSVFKDMPEGMLYLELKHNPSLNYPEPILKGNGSQTRLILSAYTTLLPLQERHLNGLMDNMYTARFVVKDNRAHRYSITPLHFTHMDPVVKGMPDGSYELYFGKGYKIGWGGISTQLNDSSPLLQRTPTNIQLLYNMGMEMNLAFDPASDYYQDAYWPHRYVYFRDGDLYAMGGILMRKDDSVLQDFNKNEMAKQEKSTASRPYIAFRDYGPPLKEGKIDKGFLKTFGMKIPERQYLALGDNHAMSGDSRVFGFVPEDNLQGAPSLILWPPGDRLGFPEQKPYPFMNMPRAIVWGIAALAGLLAWLYHRWKCSRPILQGNWKVR